MVDKFSCELLTFIDSECFKGKGFQNQHRVYASKRGWFLRPTVKLDPPAEFFMYDFVYRNRALFRTPQRSDRKVFGYRISHGTPVSGMQHYRDYKDSVSLCRDIYQHHARLDVASYFNRIYHHDLTAWWQTAGGTLDDANQLGKFLREATSGRSIDCLPQGIYPAKMIGSAFLNFLENSNRIRCAETIRLMDDFWMFDDDITVLISDFLVAQSLLSERGLSVNDQKSEIIEDAESQLELPGKLDEMKIHLLRRRSEELSQRHGYDDPEDSPEEEDLELNAEEHEYLLALLRSESLNEEDAELVLRMMEEYSSDVLEYLPILFRNFPGLAKRMYYFCQKVQDKREVAFVLLALTKSKAQLTEYQLFWFGMMAEDYLLGTTVIGELLLRLHDHRSATVISKAKILEIPETRFGLSDLRESNVRSGHSDWLAWASAVGSRVHPKGQRNHLLSYFGKSSPMNTLIGEFVKGL